MMTQFLERIILSFIISQFAKFKEKTDWDLLEKEVADYVTKIVPGTWLDDSAVMIVNFIFSTIREYVVTDDSFCLDFVKLVSGGQFDEAFSRLKHIIYDSAKR